MFIVVWGSAVAANPSAFFALLNEFQFVGIGAFIANDGHKTAADGKTVAGKIFVDMFGSQAEGTVVSERAGGGHNLFTAALADKGVVAGDEIFSH